MTTAVQMPSQIGNETQLTWLQQILRNPFVRRSNVTCQSLGTVMSLTAAVAGYYFGSGLGVSLGTLGTLSFFYNCFALSYTTDYGTLIEESKQVESLQKAKAELERQVAQLDGIESALSDEGDELEGHISTLKQQIALLTDQIQKLEAQITATENPAVNLREEGERFELGSLNRTIESIDPAVSAAYDKVVDAFQKANDLELRVIERERRLADESYRIQKAVRAFKEESPKDYGALVARFPGMVV